MQTSPSPRRSEHQAWSAFTTSRRSGLEPCTFKTDSDRFNKARSQIRRSRRKVLKHTLLCLVVAVMSLWTTTGVAATAVPVRRSNQRIGLNPRIPSPKYAIQDSIRQQKLRRQINDRLADHSASVSTTLSPTSTITKARSPIAIVTTSEASSVSPTVTSSSSSSTSRTSTTTSPSPSSTTVPSNYTLPRPFDTILGTNFTNTACPSFIQTFLVDPEFITCLPFSLLLSTSSAFFDAERSPNVLLPYVLNASCSSNATACSALFSSLAQQIGQKGNCQADLDRGNAIVVAALTGFETYDVQRQAGCLKNNGTGRFCFAEAANQSVAGDIYLYSLPDGIPPPSFNTQVSCGFCTQNLMNIYAKTANNATLPLSKVYPSGAAFVDDSCGAGFSPPVGPILSSSSSSSKSSLSASTSTFAHHTLPVSVRLLVLSILSVTIGGFNTLYGP